ncbi:MAG: right-handed parallel beta-helix repeat-containing protein [bacterium]
MYRSSRWYMFCLIGILSLIVTVTAGASTVISTSIYTSSTWTLAGSPYLVTASIEVKSTTASNITVLTIEPGVIVKFVYSYSRLTFGAGTAQRGGLIARGNSANGDIIFTSYKDDAAGGDTNGDGSTTIPAPGDWESIYFTSYSFATMNRCQVSYGSHNIYAYTSAVSITSTAISSSGEKGIYVDYDCYPVITNCQFYNNQDYPISIGAEGVRKITGCTYTSGTITNKRQGIEVRSENVKTSCTWLNQGIPYVLTGDVNVYSPSPGNVLNIQQGAILKFAYTYVRINTAGGSTTQVGGLMATGVTFTSLKDDSVGGDTYGDGTATSPSDADWIGLVFERYTISSTKLDKCIIRYGGSGSGGMIYLTACSPTFTSCTINYSGEHGIFGNSNSYPTISNCRFEHNQDYPISIEAEGIRKVTGNTFSNNIRQGIEVKSDIVHTSCSWTNQSVPYVIDANFSIYTTGNGCVLTLNPGLVLKFAQTYGEIDIAGSVTTHRGGLIATGVTFTSIHDDAVGGDTYGDGTTTTPSYNDWRYLNFDRYTISSTKLDKCMIRYGGSGTGGMIYLTACSPTFSVCSINYSGEHGIFCASNAYPTISSCRFVLNQDYPISMEAEGIRKVTGCTFSSNKRSGIEVKSDIVHTTCTWTNQSVPYVISADVSVYTTGSGCILTLNPGVVFKFSYMYAQLNIGGDNTTKRGGLLATGVTFTSIEDDSVSGDTYGDGTTTSPSPGDWECIYFDRYALSTTKLDRCIVKYGGGSHDVALYAFACSPTFSYCTVNYSNGHGIYGTSNAYPTVSNCRFENNQGYPISLEAQGIRKVTGNSFSSNNKRPGIEVQDDVVITSCTWTNQGVPYVIAGDVSVYTTGSGCILTLSSGDILKFAYMYGQLNIGGDNTTKRGGLIATGVTFTSLKDDSVGGDTYGDGTATTASPGDWDCLNIDRYALSTTKLDRCIVKYGGQTYPGEVYIVASAPTFSYCTIDYSDEHGIYALSNGYPTISNCVFRYNEHYPVSIEAEGIRKVTGCTFSSNTRSAIEVRDDIVITSGTWTNQGVPYVLAGDVSVYTTGNGCILTISNGVRVKFADSNVQLNIAGSDTTRKGGLIATGVAFTSLKDDTLGGDTYGDGTATSPAPSNWDAIVFDKYTLSTTKLDRCIIRYGGNNHWGQLYVNGCSPTFSNCTIDYAILCGVYAYSNGYPTVSNCAFRNNQDYPISIEAEGIRKVTNCSFSNNKRQGIEARADIIMTSGTWANQGIPYVIAGSVTISTTGSGNMLTLNPGVIIKFADSDSELVVGNTWTAQYGGLIAVGNVYAPIYFTSIKDDSIGGDTYGDGTATSPKPGDWRYIHTDVWSTPSTVFDHCIIRYAQYGIFNGSQATLNVRYCLIEKHGFYGIYSYFPLEGQMHHNTIINNIEAGIYINTGYPPLITHTNLCQNPIGLLTEYLYAPFTFSYNNISKNTTYGIQNKTTTVTIPGEYNWWGDTTGPYDGSTSGLYNPNGQGNSVSNYIDYDPWLRENPEQPRQLPDIKLLKGYQQEGVFDLDRYILDTAASFTWSTNPNTDQAEIVINTDNNVDYTLSRTTAFVGIDSVAYCANWYAKSTSMLKYSSYIFDRISDAIVDNGNEIENCWLDLREGIIKDSGTAYPTIYKSMTKFDDATDAARLTVTLSGSTAEILSSSALKAPATVIFTIQKDSTGTDYDKQLIRVYEIVNTNGHFGVASDTTKWYFQLYSDGTGPGTLSWVTGYSDGSGIAKITQTAGQKGKIGQTFKVSKPGWYTARARIATDMTAASKQQKVYLYLQELNASDQIIEVANQVLSSGAGAFTGAGGYRDLEITYYAKGTSLGVQLVAINPASSGVTGSIYIDNIWVYPAPPIVSRCYGATQVDLANANFDTTTTAWMVEVYSDGTGPGTWSWDTGWAGRTGLLKVNQAGGEKGKASQLFTFPSEQRSASASVWVYSGATSSSNSQKVYLYLYSYDAGYAKVVESGNAILQAGMWTPNQWRELKFGYTPLTAVNAVQVVAINQTGKPAANIYFDEISVDQDQDANYYWDHSLF